MFLNKLYNICISFIKKRHLINIIKTLINICILRWIYCICLYTAEILVHMYIYAIAYYYILKLKYIFIKMKNIIYFICSYSVEMLHLKRVVNEL